VPVVNDEEATREQVIVVVTRGVQLWRIFYGDDTVARSEDVSWRDAPEFDVQVVLVFRLSPSADRLWCETATGQDEYQMEDDPQVKYGSWCENYQRICLAAEHERRRQFELPVARFISAD
jgi:hypothetical protein